MSKKIDEIRAKMNSPEGKKRDEEFWNKANKTVRYAAVMKKHMIARNLTRAKAKCPYCEGHWHGVLAGPKKHLHMRCDGNCGTFMME